MRGYWSMSVKMIMTAAYVIVYIFVCLFLYIFYSVPRFWKLLQQFMRYLHSLYFV